MTATLHSLPQLRTARELLEEQSRSDRPQELSTGSRAFDSLLDGGLTSGETVEIYGQRSSGRFSLVLRALAEATRTRQAALVDLGSGLDAQTAEAVGIDFEHLLWARPRNIRETLQSAETLIKTGLPLVAVDLGLPPLSGGRGASTSWQRLARAARCHQVALLIASPYPVTGIAPEWVIGAYRPAPCWQGRLPSSRLLRGLSSTLTLERCRTPLAGDPRHGESEVLRLRTAGEIEGVARRERRGEPAAPEEVFDRRAIA